MRLLLALALVSFGIIATSQPVAMADRGGGVVVGGGFAEAPSMVGGG